MNQKNKHNCVDCGFKAGIFKFLSKVELTRINDNRFEVEFNAGETIFKQGAPNTHVISFTHGLAKINIEGKNGKNLFLKFVTPTHFISGVGLYTDQRHHYSVQAIEASKACFIDIKIMQDIIFENKVFANEFIGEMNQNMIYAYEKLVTISQMNSEGKVADLLLTLSDDIFKKAKFNLTISKKELAEYVGLSKESLFKALKLFNEGGIIKNGGDSIEIIDKKSLLTIKNLS